MPVAGSVWVESSNFKFCDINGTVRTYTGTDLGVLVPTGIAGSLWVQGSDLHYIDANGRHRICASLDLGAVAGAVKGSFWIEAYAHGTLATGTAMWISETGTKRVLHNDSAHIDGSEYMHSDGSEYMHSDGSEYMHDDYVYSGGGHQDGTWSYMHSDGSYSYMHSDGSYSYMHSDAPHTDTPT